MRDERYCVDTGGDGLPCGCLEAELLPLVEIMLGVVQRCQEAVLQDTAENLLVIRGVLGHLCGGLPADDISGETLVRGLDRLFERVLHSPDEPFARTALLPGNGGQLSGASLAPRCWERLIDHESLTNWFCALAARLRDGHPRAVEMLRLRCTGLGTREIAERLQMPVRLVRRVLGELRWASQEIEAPGVTP